MRASMERRAWCACGGSEEELLCVCVCVTPTGNLLLLKLLTIMGSTCVSLLLDVSAHFQSGSVALQNLQLLSSLCARAGRGWAGRSVPNQRLAPGNPSGGKPPRQLWRFGPCTHTWGHSHDGAAAHTTVWTPKGCPPLPTPPPPAAYGLPAPRLLQLPPRQALDVHASGARARPLQRRRRASFFKAYPARLRARGTGAQLRAAHCCTGRGYAARAPCCWRWGWRESRSLVVVVGDRHGRPRDRAVGALRPTLQGTRERMVLPRRIAPVSARAGVHQVGVLNG